MNIFDGTIISNMVENNKHLFQSLLPELIKRLILSSNNTIENIRLPSNDDMWAPGFDGIIKALKGTTYVCAGQSVWEIGTNSNTLVKIEADYNKRERNHLGIDPKETEFYLVNPYIWAYDNKGYPITKWENDHKSNWKAVHIIDATIIADWINSEPVVGAWLLEKIGQESSIDYASLFITWEQFASKTSPAFSHSLFLEGRENEEKELLKQLDKQIIKIKAESFIDAFGFCLSALIKETHTANSVIVINNQTTYKEISKICKGKTFLINFKLECDVINGNKVILCYNKEDQTVNADIDLLPLSKTSFNNAIKEMELPNEIATNLYNKTHGNLLSLIRAIPGNAAIGSPKWSTQEHLDLLAPILLLRNFDSQDENEQNLISYLADEDYNVIIDKYNSWLRLEDSPIKYVSNHFVLVNYEEAWNVLKLNTSSPILKRMMDLIYDIIYYDLHTTESKPSYINSYTNKRLHCLFVDLIYFSDIENDDEIINTFVKKLITSFPSSSLIVDNLHLLAEISPNIIMSFIKDDATKDNGIIKSNFSSGHNSRNYCKILYALDNLVLNETTRVAACNCLFELSVATEDNSFVYSNSPKESLLAALCLWNNHSVLTVQEKQTMLEKYLSINEEYTVPFIIDLLLKDNVIYGINDYTTKGIKYTEILLKDLFKATNALATIALKKSIELHKIDCIKRLIRGYHIFDNTILMDMSKEFANNEYSLEELVKLNIEVREAYYYAKKTPEKANWVPALEEWLRVTTPSDEVGQACWLFSSYYHFYYLDSFDETNWEEKGKAIESKRKELLNTLKSNHSITELSPLVQFSDNNYLLGIFYASNMTSEELFKLTSIILHYKKNNLLYGIINATNKETCINILNSLPQEEQLLALQNTSRKDLFDWIDTSEKEQAYWVYQSMIEYDEITFKKLIKHSPCNLLPYFAFHQKGSLLVMVDKIVETFEAILSLPSSKPSNHYTYEFDTILSELDKEGYYSDEWAKLCSKLYDENWLHQYPNALKKYYFENPTIACNRIIEFTGNSYAEFNFQYQLPKYAYENQEAFSFFVKTFVDKSNDSNILLSTLGSILGRSINDDDNIFPHVYVRIEMEKYKHLELNKKVLIGKFNARGVRTIGDGSSEKQTALKYKEDAQKLDISYPETAQLLRWISEDYESESKSDQLYSETGFYY